MSSNKSKFLQFVDYRVRVTIGDGRMLVGTFLAFDKHLNVVLNETEEFRFIKTKKDQPERQIRRAIGMIILRGESIISISAEAPPTQSKKADIQQAKTSIQQQRIIQQQPGQSNISNVPIQTIGQTDKGTGGIMPSNLMSQQAPPNPVQQPPSLR